MFKNTILVSMFFILFFLISCSEDDSTTAPDQLPGYRMVEELSYEYDSVSDTWILEDTWNFDYDSYGRIEMEYGTSWFMGGSFQEVFIYENTSTVLPSERVIYDEVKDWVVDYINHFSYENGKTKERLSNNYYEGDIVNRSQTLYTYDNNLLTSKIRYLDFTGEWEISRKDTWTYSSGKLIEYSYDWSEGITRYTYSYDNDKLIEGIRYSWDNESWNTSERYVYSYEGGKLKQVAESYYYNSEWINERKTVYSYSNDFLSTQIIYEWNNDEQMWKDDTKIEYDYDENDNYTRNIYYRWNETVTEYIPMFKIEIIYEKAHGNYLDILKILYPDYFYTGSTLSQYFPQPTKDLKRMEYPFNFQVNK